jgi:N-acyl homoserine lactone hydrolase
VERDLSRKEFIVGTGLACSGLALGLSASGCSSGSTSATAETAIAATRLYVVKSGELTLPVATVLNRDSLSNKEALLDPNMMMLPVWGALIQHRDATILFDAGLYPDKGSQTYRIYGHEFRFVTDDDSSDYFLKNVSSIVSASAVDYIVLSHMHGDHTGFIGAFPNARIMVGREELADAGDGGPTSGESRWSPVSGDLYQPMKLVEGVSVIPFGPGHSSAMLALLVELPQSGNIILCSDISHTAENYGPPTVKPAGLMMVDEEGYVAAHEHLRRLAREKCAQVWFSHDAAQFASLIKWNEGHYT